MTKEACGQPGSEREGGPIVPYKGTLQWPNVFLLGRPLHLKDLPLVPRLGTKYMGLCERHSDPHSHRGFFSVGDCVCLAAMLPCGHPFDPVVLAHSSHSLLNRQLLHSLLVKVSIH